MIVSEPLTGEPLALDLVNTRPLAHGKRLDLLGTPEQLARWLAHEPDLQAEVGVDTPSPVDLDAVHRVRDHVDDAVRALHHGGRPPVASLQGLADAQRAAPAVRELVWDGTAVSATVRRDGRLGVRLAAHLAEAAADLLTSPVIGRLRECEADDCIMLFLATRPGRRWCSSTRCGNRARVARHYQRHKDAGAVSRTARALRQGDDGASGPPGTTETGDDHVIPGLPRRPRGQDR